MSHAPRACALAIGIALGAGCAESGSDNSGAGAGAGLAGGGAGAIATAGQGGAGTMATAGAGGAGVGAGRGGAGGGAGGTGGMGAAGSGGSAPSGPPTFTRVWNEVLVAKGCAGEFCHGSGQGTLSMDNKLDAYMSLFEKPASGAACGTSGKVRVKANDPMQSLLLQKMTGPTAAPCGDLMPVGVKYDPNCISKDPAVCTTQLELQLVRDWIMAGAKND